VQIDPNIWENIPSVSESENDFLCRPFSEEEIKIALWQMEKPKQLAQIRYQLNFFKAVGKLLKLILFNYLMTFSIT
jgi:hypothetical protein